MFDRRALTLTLQEEQEEQARQEEGAGQELGRTGAEAGVAGGSASVRVGGVPGEGARQKQNEAGLPDKVREGEREKSEREEGFGRWALDDAVDGDMAGRERERRYGIEVHGVGGGAWTLQPQPVEWCPLMTC